MVMLRIGASLVSDSPTAATVSGHKHTHTRQCARFFPHAQTLKERGRYHVWMSTRQ